MSEQSLGDTDRSVCTVYACEKPAEKKLEWPEPGGLVASFCDGHAEQKVSITAVSERSVEPETDQDGDSR